MPLDILPINRAIHCREGGGCVVPFLIRDSLDVAVVRAGHKQTGGWAFRVYKESGQSPETAIYSELTNALSLANADSSEIILTAVSTAADAPQAAGISVRHKLFPTALFSAVGGQTFTLEYTFTLLGNAGTGGLIVVPRIPLVIDPAYN